MRNKPYCPQCRTAAQVHQVRDSSLALRRLCDKLKVKCPKCGYVTERSLLSDHLVKCGLEDRGRPTKSPTKVRTGRSKSRDALEKKRSPIKWHRSRDGLDQAGRSRSRDRLNDRHRSRSRDQLRSASNEQLDAIDLAREIERDIERINIYQGKKPMGQIRDFLIKVR